MLLLLFAMGEIWFILICCLFVFVEFCLAERDNGGWGLTTFILFGVLLTLFTDVISGTILSTFGWREWVMALLAYLPVGLVVSLILQRLDAGRHRHAVEEYKETWRRGRLGRGGQPDISKAPESSAWPMAFYKFSMRLSNKSIYGEGDYHEELPKDWQQRIVNAQVRKWKNLNRMVIWPFSIVSYFVHHLFSDLLEEIWRRFRGLFTAAVQNGMKSQFKDL